MNSIHIASKVAGEHQKIIQQFTCFYPSFYVPASHTPNDAAYDKGTHLSKENIDWTHSSK
jgi:hypothetical protein